jgi:hypothetical protein
MRNDIVFRDELTHFRNLWKTQISESEAPQDGFFVIDEMNRPRRKFTYDPEIINAYDLSIRKIIRAIRPPIQYAGPGEWLVFDRPVTYKHIREQCISLPETTANDFCVIISQELWAGFQEISLCIEALCIHE